MYRDKIQITYDFILQNELCSEPELDMTCDVGGFNMETLNYVIYRQTAYHDIDQLYACEKDYYYFSDEVKAAYFLDEVQDNI